MWAWEQSSHPIPPDSPSCASPLSPPGKRKFFVAPDAIVGDLASISSLSLSAASSAKGFTIAKAEQRDAEGVTITATDAVLSVIFQQDLDGTGSVVLEGQVCKEELMKVGISSQKRHDVESIDARCLFLQQRLNERELACEDTEAQCVTLRARELDLKQKQERAEEQCVFLQHQLLLRDFALHQAQEQAGTQVTAMKQQLYEWEQGRAQTDQAYCAALQQRQQEQEVAKEQAEAQFIVLKQRLEAGEQKQERLEAQYAALEIQLVGFELKLQQAQERSVAQRAALQLLLRERELESQQQRQRAHAEQVAEAQQKREQEQLSEQMASRLAELVQELKVRTHAEDQAVQALELAEAEIASLVQAVANANMHAESAALAWADQAKARVREQEQAAAQCAALDHQLLLCKQMLSEADSLCASLRQQLCARELMLKEACERLEMYEAQRIARWELGRTSMLELGPEQAQLQTAAPYFEEAADQESTEEEHGAWTVPRAAADVHILMEAVAAAESCTAPTSGGVSIVTATTAGDGHGASDGGGGGDGSGCGCGEDKGGDGGSGSGSSGDDVFSSPLAQLLLKQVPIEKLQEQPETQSPNFSAFPGAVAGTAEQDTPPSVAPESAGGGDGNRLASLTARQKWGIVTKLTFV